MDQLKWTTPIKGESKYIAMTSPKVYKTPVKQNGLKSKHKAYSGGCFGVLPSHITPPSGLTKFIARNPFESDLTNRLHLSVISPSVFSKVASPSKNSSGGFAWSVEELALIQPANIEEFPIQQMHCSDPEAEIKAQAAIDQFFKGNQIIPSPWEVRRKENRLRTKLDTPCRNLDNLNAGAEASQSKKDGWTQTILTLPPQLPAHVEEVLKPYFTFTQDQNVEAEDANSSNNSLRRKLFFNHDECQDNEDESSICLSPVKMNGSLVLSSSPPESGMLIHGTPLKCTQKPQRTYDTPVVRSGDLSPPNMSPIHSTINNMSCESVRSRARSVARLDFTTDMSIDQSAMENKSLPSNQSMDDSIEKVAVGPIEKYINDPQHLHVEATSISEDALMKNKSMPKHSTLSENTVETEIVELDKPQNVVQKLKFLTESSKVYTNESCTYQQNNTAFGMSDQQSACMSAQDTGYQTCSMSSTNNVTDSYSTPTKQKIYWGDRIMLRDDELRLSDWKENIKNLFSSTPSKCSREKGNHIFPEIC